MVCRLNHHFKDMKEREKIEYNGITVSFEEITPQMAKDILDETKKAFAADNTKNYQNRRVRNGTVNLYSKDMEDGNWEINGATIVFDQKGRLMDGQHRLNSIIKSGVTQICIVVRGVKDTAMPTIDSGLKRSLENYLQFQAESYTNGSASAVKVKVLLDKGKLETDQSNGNLKTTNKEYVEEYMAKDKLYQEAVHFANGIHKAASCFRVAEVAGIYAHLVDTKGFDKDIVKEFFNRLTIITLNEKSIYKRLYDRLDVEKRGGRIRMEAYMGCWNAHVKGTKNFPPIDENSWFLTPKPYYKECA